LHEQPALIAVDRAQGTCTGETHGGVQDVPIWLTLFGAPPTSGVATVVSQARSTRFRRALTALLLCWVLACVVIFVPPHLPWVAASVITGVVLFVRRLREDVRLLRLCGTCPRCGRSHEHAIGGRFRSGRTIVCPHCHNQLTLHIDPPAARSKSAPVACAQARREGVGSERG
jgi:hypothetical protein